MAVKILAEFAAVLAINHRHAGTLRNPRFEIHSRSRKHGLFVYTCIHFEPRLPSRKQAFQ